MSVLDCILLSDGEHFSSFRCKIFPIESEGSPALFSHEGKNLAVVPIFVVCYQKSLKLRHMVFGNDNQTLSLGNHIVICKNNGGSFVPVVENLRFHAIQAQMNGCIYRIGILLQNLPNLLFYDTRYGQRRNIFGSTDGYRYTTDPSAVGVKALVDQLGNMAKDRIIAFNL